MTLTDKQIDNFIQFLPPINFELDYLDNFGHKEIKDYTLKSGLILAFLDFNIQETFKTDSGDNQTPPSFFGTKRKVSDIKIYLFIDKTLEGIVLTEKQHDKIITEIETILINF